MIPIAVDLDGTLIKTNMLHESALKFFASNPLKILYVLLWLFRGKAVLKWNLAHNVKIEPQHLPYNQELLSWLKEQRDQGRSIILCTASNAIYATAISKHLGIFSEIIASGERINLSSKHKVRELEQRFGRAGFDYVGNSRNDLLVWKKAHRAIVVNASRRLLKKTLNYCEVEHVFPSSKVSIKAYSQVFRIHQWLKNLLVFIPLFAAHKFTDLDALLTLILAFISFSLCASSVYITNDLLELERDRNHPRKCKRPFAGGIVPAWKGIFLGPILLLSSLVLGYHVNLGFLKWLIVYFVLTCAYTLKLRGIVLIDCITLAMFYTIRIIAGAVAVKITLSFWLLAFSVFLFLSLAFVKRYTELKAQLVNGKDIFSGRGYDIKDTPLVQTMGITSGYAAVLILAFYINSDAVLNLYRFPEAVWGILPTVLFWISWIWLQAHRDNMHDDPLVFALKDKTSLLAGVVFLAILTICTFGW